MMRFFPFILKAVSYGILVCQLGALIATVVYDVKYLQTDNPLFLLRGFVSLSAVIALRFLTEFYPIKN
jgi:hypothetical protein